MTLAIIWQIKDLKVDEAGKYKKAEVEKNLRQLSGARRAMFDLRVPIQLKNPRRGKELFNPDQIKTVHHISVLMGESDEPFPFFQIVKDKLIHVFTREFADLALSELDTVSDFCDYLRKKEAIDQNKRVVVAGGEENSLGKILGKSARFLMDGQLRQHFDRWHCLVRADAQSAIHREETTRSSQLWMGQRH